MACEWRSGGRGLNYFWDSDIWRRADELVEAAQIVWRAFLNVYAQNGLCFRQPANEKIQQRF